MPNSIPVIEIPAFKLTESASLWKNLGRAVESVQPKTMEQIGQAYGYILYRTRVDGPAKGSLTVNEVRDYATVFVDGYRVGTLDRRLNQNSVPIEIPPGPRRLDILVENLGRINFGPQLRDDRKGITQSVTLDGRELSGWKIYPLPMNDPGSLDFSTGVAARPAFYRGTFRLKRAGDTFLDVSSLGMGVAWVNGHNLGRFWNIGPQQTMYVPGVWLKKGRNEVIIFDTRDDTDVTLVGRLQPVLNRLK